MNRTKPFNIAMSLVVKAHKLVRENAGAAGIDKQSLDDFDLNLEDNLYKLWNRMSSGSYFPPPVKAVPIPKKNGGIRVLGVPTVTDRIAQAVVKQVFEPLVEPHFYPDSYGYRPNKSALDAIETTRKRCWRYDWVLEFDISKLFDSINHDLLMRAVKRHTNNKWIILYIERWLKAPIQSDDGISARSSGTPQGGVISPILSNIFLHYVFDAWMTKHNPTVPWCRYADDGLAHCKTEKEAQLLLAALEKRFKECGLEIHPDKTKIVYCKDGKRRGKHQNTEFNFLGYCFRRRWVRNRIKNDLFLGFTPAVSKQSLKLMRVKIRKTGLRKRTDLSLNEIAIIYNPILRGWINYYGKYGHSDLRPIFRHFNRTLVKWAMRKYKRLEKHKTRASVFIGEIAKRDSQLFVHWRYGTVGVFA